MTALHRPPHLKAMIPDCISVQSIRFEWPTGTPDPMHVCWMFLTSDRAMQNIHQVDWYKVYSHLPLITMDEAAGRPMPAWKEWFEHCSLDDWWKVLCSKDGLRKSIFQSCTFPAENEVKKIGTPLNFAGMTRFAPTERTRKAQRLIMGPWPHQINQSTKVGAIGLWTECAYRSAIQAIAIFRSVVEA